MQYRREIDGLRAVALIPIVLFHAGFAPFRGGFVGVDVFFVISGYLITSILLAEISAGQFSVARFYERRARRILPALFLVLITCLPFAWMWLLPEDMKAFSQSLVAVCVFASNLLFWRESGYFETAGELKPLLHTWSLAVEEQFYLLFPPLLALTCRLLRPFSTARISAVLAAAAALSLAAAQWGSAHYPVATFFLLPTRAWEMLMGALVALRFSRVEAQRRAHTSSNLGSLAGLALIAYAVFGFDDRIPFPSAWALVPTIGTALIILFATPQTLVGKLLGNRVLVGIGLISYSAYLWHQPLFTFARHRSLHPPSAAVFGVLSLTTLLLAYVSWRFVEQPFRRKDRFTRRRIFAYAASGSLAIILVGAVGHVTDGYYFRPALKHAFQDVEHRMSVNYGLSSACDREFTTTERCRTNVAPEFLLWGDSFAMHLVPGLLASKPGLKMAQMTISTCGPILGIAPTTEKYPPSWGRKCIASNDKVFDWLKAHPSIKYALLSSVFTQYVEPGKKVLLRNNAIVDGRSVAEKSFADTLEALKSIHVTPIVFSPTPQNGEDVGRCQLKALRLGIPSSCDFDVSVAETYQRNEIDFLRRIETKHKIIWLSRGLCSDGRCRVEMDNVLIYRDRGHLSHEGSAYIGAKMDFYKLITN